MGRFDEWFMQFSAVLLAAVLAGGTGLWLYAKQLRTERDKNRQVLSDYMDYLIANVPTKFRPGNITIPYINTELINQLLAEEEDPTMVTELVKLQGHIETFDFFSKQSLSSVFSSSGSGQSGANFSHSSIILNSARTLSRQAIKCRQMLNSPSLQFVQSTPPAQELLAALVATGQSERVSAENLCDALSSGSKYDFLDVLDGLSKLSSEGLVDEFNSDSAEKLFRINQSGLSRLERSGKSA